MSQENVEIVRKLYAAWERGDYASTEWAHPKIEIVFADGPSPGSSTGLGGMTEGWRDFISAWDAYRQEADEYREVDDGRVLVLSRFSGRGKRSGVKLGQKGAALFHLHGGKVTRIVRYWDRGHALADLGLQELAMSQENVDRLRAGLEVFYRTGEFPSEMFDSDAEWMVAREDPDAVTHRGVEAIRGYLAQWTGVFEGIDVRADETIDAGDKVFAWIRFSGKGITSGASVQMELAEVYTFRDGKVVRVEEYFDRREALEAAGVSE